MIASVGVNPEQQQQPVSKDLEQVFMDHYDLVYRTAYRITGHDNDAEDVLQTLFLRRARRASSLDLKAGWPPYLWRAALNVSLDLVRKRSRSVSITEMEPWIKESGRIRTGSTRVRSLANNFAVLSRS